MSIFPWTDMLNLDQERTIRHFVLGLGGVWFFNYLGVLVLVMLATKDPNSYLCKTQNQENGNLFKFEHSRGNTSLHYVILLKH